MQQSPTHGGSRHPLRGKTRIKVILIGVLIVTGSWFAPEGKVGAVAQLIGATSTAAVVLRESKTSRDSRTLA